MAVTATDLKSEAQRHRALAAQHTAIAESLIAAAAKLATLGNWTRDTPEVSTVQTTTEPALHISPSNPAAQELAGMTQPAAILHILRRHGPLSTREIFARLAEQGMFFKNTSYIAAIMARLKPRVMRSEDGRYHLAEQASLPLEKADS